MAYEKRFRRVMSLFQSGPVLVSALEPILKDRDRRMIAAARDVGLLLDDPATGRTFDPSRFLAAPALGAP